MGEEEEAEEQRWNNQKKQATLIDEISNKMINGDPITKIQSARDIRTMIRNRSSNSSSSSSAKLRVKFAAAGVIQPLVQLLCSGHHGAREASLLALLNLASRNDRNKEQIVTCGALPPLVNLLRFQNNDDLRELATAAILTLSAAPPNKPPIAASGAIPLLVQILSCGTVQGRVDAVTALHNLSTSKEPPTIVPDAKAVVPPLINLLKECKKHSKFAEKTTALIEIMARFEEGRTAITDAEDGILTLVETIEEGSLGSTEHAVGALLALCLSSRCKYRELILKEGAIPGLLRLTVNGTYEARVRAQALLELLRECSSEKRPSSSVLEEMVREMAERVDRSENPEKIVVKDVVENRRKGSH